MDWIFCLNLFGLGCAALSMVTWRLFKPKSTFYAPSSRATTIFSLSLMAGLFGLWLLTKIDLMPATSAKNIPSFYVAVFLTETHGRAIYHHFDHATRTPRDLWTRFLEG